MGMAAQKVHTVLFRRLVHAVAFCDGKGHGLFDDHMFLVLGGGNGVFGVELIRRRNVDEVDVGTLTHRLDAGKHLGIVFLAKLCQSVSTKIGCGRNLQIGETRDGRQNLSARHSQTGHSHAQSLIQNFALASASSLWVYAFQLLVSGIISEITRK